MPPKEQLLPTKRQEEKGGGVEEGAISLLRPKRRERLD
jgi:hypothetical protein